MIKLLLTGVWACIVTLGAVYFSIHMATAPAVDEDAAKKEKLELVKGETITVPLIADGKVNGYFIGRISFMMDKEKIMGLKLPLTEYMTDELFTLLVGSKMVDISNTAHFDLAGFRDRIKTDMNKLLGDAYVGEVLVEQLDYLAKTDTRLGAVDANPPAAVKIVSGEAASADAPAPAH